MKSTTISIVAPKILSSFSPDLLISILDRNKKNVETKILKLQRIKIRTQDLGKRKEFDKLIKEYYEEYERKKTEEKNYETKIKDAHERSRLSTSSSTVQFKRYKD